jgi:lipopolysaccharide transport system permease protein
MKPAFGACRAIIVSAMSAEPSLSESTAIDDGQGVASNERDVQSSRQVPSPPRMVIVRAENGWRAPDLLEVWHYRELFLVLALRDIKVRYKQTVLGATWAIVQPLFTMIVFTMIARFSSISTDGIRPEVFYYCGMLPWLLFANSLSSAGNSLLASQHLVAKVYFPRLIIPAASVICALIDFLIAFAVLLPLMIFYRVTPGPQIVLLPIFVALGLLAALGFGLWLSALNVQFRDVRHIAPFLTQLWLFCTPVLYSSTSIHGPWKTVLLGVNPIAAIVEGVRWCLLGRPRPGAGLASSIVTILIVFATSLLYFQRVDRTMADRL